MSQSAGSTIPTASLPHIHPSVLSSVALALALAVSPVVAGTWFDSNTIEHDGLTRHFRYYLPSDLPAGSPLLFVLHGGGGDMFGVMNGGAMSEWPAIADEHGLLLIVPNGVDPDTGGTSGDNQQWNDCRGDMVVRSSDADDVGFINALIDWAVGGFDIDTNRVYSTGASNGGMMSYRLAFELGHRIAAIAPFIANIPAADECSVPVDPTPVFICNGDAETNYMPWEGGCVVANQGCSRGTVISAEASRDWWIRFNRADPDQPDVTVYDDLDPDDGCTVTSWRYSGGIQGSEVIFYRVHGGGHTVPTIDHPTSALVRFLLGLGNESHDIEGARQAWAFLSGRTLNGPGPGSSDPGESAYVRIEKSGDGTTLSLRWSTDCGAGTAYGIYRGDLNEGYESIAAEPGFCSVEDTAASIPLGTGDADFFLVVPNTATTEGGYGAGPAGASRPPARSGCHPRATVDACAGAD
jgi:polyhydroxybutyrate depolymerase